MLIKEYTNFQVEEIAALYASVGWKNYTDHPDMLAQAYRNSLCVLAAYEDEHLLGVIRAVGDGASILLIQDILVAPTFQGKGIGTALLKAVLERYANIYQIQLLTDATEKTIRFYEKNGLRRAAALGCEAFLRINI